MAYGVTAYQWKCCGVNTAEQKKLSLFTGSSFPIHYVNFKINFLTRTSNDQMTKLNDASEEYRMKINVK